MYGDDKEKVKGELVNYALITQVDLEPSCFEDVCTNGVWLQTMQEKIHSIDKNDTW